MINRICRVILKRTGMEVSVSSDVSRALLLSMSLSEFKSFGARLSGLAKPRFKGSSMRVKKRVKRRVKKGMKRVKSAPPEAYLAGVGVLVGGAAVLLLATTKRGQELLARTAQQVLRPEADQQESRESNLQDEAEEDEPEPQESNLQDDAEEDANGDDESRVTELKPQRPRSAAPGRRPHSPGKAPASAES